MELNSKLVNFKNNIGSNLDNFKNSVTKFNSDNVANRIDCKLFSLDDIKDAYYGKPIRDKQNFSYRITTINKGTTLSINNEAYGTDLAIDANYILTPVEEIYNMCKSAFEKEYPLFDENIREYLGSTGAVNKKIVSTLHDVNERNNFFF